MQKKLLLLYMITVQLYGQELTMSSNISWGRKLEWVRSQLLEEIADSFGQKAPVYNTLAAMSAAKIGLMFKEYDFFKEMVVYSKGRVVTTLSAEHIAASVKLYRSISSQKSNQELRIIGSGKRRKKNSNRDASVRHLSSKRAHTRLDLDAIFLI